MTENFDVTSPLPGEEPGGEGAPRIRLMGEADLPAILSIDRTGDRDGRRVFYERKIAACLREPGLNTSLVAELDGAPAGFLLGQLYFGEFGIPAQRAVLDTLAVHPEFRRRGVARAMVEQYRKNMTALRVEAIDTLVDWERFDLLAFFKSIGFRPSRVIDLVWNVADYPFAGKAGGAVVRPAEEKDVRAVVDIDREAGLVSRPVYFAAKFGNARNYPDKNIFVVAELDGDLAGFMVGSLYQGEFGIEVTRGVIDSFGVGESFRHAGVASAIMSFLLQRVNKLGVTQMETLCRWNNWELLRFFEYVGFRPSPRINLEWRVG